MIDQIVRHAGSALHAQRLGTDVERSRAALVVAREPNAGGFAGSSTTGSAHPSPPRTPLDAIRGAVAEPATAASSTASGMTCRPSSPTSDGSPAGSVRPRSTNSACATR